MKHFILAVTFLLFSEIAFCYSIGNPPYWYYIPAGYYEASNHRNHNMYQNNIERNKYELVKYYCLISKTQDEWGWVLEKSAIGCVGYQYQQGIGRRERIPCHRTQDTYPVVKSFKEAREYQD